MKEEAVPVKEGTKRYRSKNLKVFFFKTHTNTSRKEICNLKNFKINLFLESFLDNSNSYFVLFCVVLETETYCTMTMSFNNVDVMLIDDKEFDRPLCLILFLLSVQGVGLRGSGTRFLYNPSCP